jgi:peptide/nickel transport system permease protein
MADTTRTTSAGDASASAAAAPRRSSSPWAHAARQFWRNRSAVVGLAVLVAVVLAALFAPYVSPYDPIETNFRARYQPPSMAHPMGTDRVGRDVSTRILYGARISLRVGLVAVSIAALLGTAIGLVAGYYRGWVDEVLMRFIDVVMAMPSILLAIAIVFALGPSLFNVMIAIGIATMPNYARVVRASVLSAREHVYVEAARASGMGDARIIVKHILPNVFAPVLVLGTLGLGSAILSVAALSFLGLGAAPPTPEWGILISDGRDALGSAWWISTFPGLAIGVVVLAVNLVGDGLRDALDPRMRGAS